MKKVIYIILTFFFLTLISFTFIKEFRVMADDNQNVSIKKESITPDMETRYKIKRGIEKIEGLFAKFQGKRAQVTYLSNLSNIRLSELYYLASENKDSYIETASSRYITTLGQLTETINGDKSYDGKVKNYLQDHSKILTNLLQRYPAGSSNWLLVKQALDTSNSTLSSLSN